ncbi:unnamed protein product, partial [Rotaria sordida]
AFVPAPRATSSVFATTSTAPFTFGPPSAAPGLFGSSTSPAAAPVVGPTAFTFGTSSTAAPQPTSFTFGPPSAASTVSIFGTSSTAAPQPTSFGFGTSTASFGVDGAASTARAEADMTYDVIENAAVNEDQAERIYQKWQQR